MIPSYDKIPQELRALPIWGVYRREKRKDKTGALKDTKVPYNGVTGRHAKTNDPTTWGTFEKAKAALKRGRYEGLAMLLIEPYTGVDLDGCCPKKGPVEKWAADILGELNTYSELSPSGEGVHAIAKGPLPEGRRQFDFKDRDHHGIGLYDFQRGRFFCMTGNALNGAAIAERTAELGRIHARFFSPKEEQPKPNAKTDQPQPDDDLIGRARRAKDGGKFARLWDGEWKGDYASQSEADSALCMKLAFWTSRDAGQIDALFRRSGLMRDKWNREDYRESTIARAIEQTTETWKPSQRGAKPRVNGHAAAASAPEPEITEGVIPWPAPINETGMYGLAGEFVRLVDPHTEADRSAILLTFLTYAGNLIGRHFYMTAGADYHCGNLFTIICGPTAYGRKGSAISVVDAFFRRGARAPGLGNVLYGITSGEGLIWEIRDPIYRHQFNKKAGKTEEEIVDPGVSDKRLLVSLGEFYQCLCNLRRKEAILSSILRQAWDGDRISSPSKNSPAKATGAHISLLACISRDELLRAVSEHDADNGLLNRFIYGCSRRSKLLPEGGRLFTVFESDAWRELQERFNRNIAVLGEPVRLKRSPDAQDDWGYDHVPNRGIYCKLSETRAGAYGNVTARATAQVNRVALIEAVINGSSEIQREHQDAAFEIWRYSEDTNKYIFAERLDDPTAQDILVALRAAGDRGLARKDIHALWSGHKDVSLINCALASLAQTGLAWCDRTATAGRSKEHWYKV